ncbi:MAG: cytochrome b/b6 domain-containing protein [Myxococcales bacterium]|nr:cytochrome b/b6 domain-containing protein [Myxococcales bacterium]
MNKPPKIVTREDGTVMVERFSPIRRVEHTLAMVTFVVLVLTGFPQSLRGDVSLWIMNLFGGLDAMRRVHRIAGIVFCAHAGAHLLSIVIGIVTGRMRPTLLPTPQDLRDAWHNLLYYLGFRERGPELPKFDYRQKFEYIGLILGGMVMVFSGLILMFPMQAAQLLPGQLIPAAAVAHSKEAVLALLVLVIWHVYSVTLSPEVFPLDRTIFSGYIDKEELKERHTLEYRRIFGDEGLEEAIEEAVEKAPETSDEAKTSTDSARNGSATQNDPSGAI